MRIHCSLGAHQQVRLPLPHTVSSVEPVSLLSAIGADADELGTDISISIADSIASEGAKIDRRGCVWQKRCRCFRGRGRQRMPKEHSRASSLDADGCIIVIDVVCGMNGRK